MSISKGSKTLSLILVDHSEPTRTLELVVTVSPFRTVEDDGTLGDLRHEIEVYHRTFLNDRCEVCVRTDCVSLFPHEASMLKRVIDFLSAYLAGPG